MNTLEVFFLFGLSFFAYSLYLGIKKLRRQLKADWKETEGRVIAFDLMVYNKHPKYELNARYSYEVEGKSYESGLVTSEGSYVAKEDELVKIFGSKNPETVKVYYDASNPSYAVLLKSDKTKLYITTAITALGFLYFFLGAIQLFFVENRG